MFNNKPVQIALSILIILAGVSMTAIALKWLGVSFKVMVQL